MDNDIVTMTWLTALEDYEDQQVSIVCLRGAKHPLEPSAGAVESIHRWQATALWRFG